MKTLLIIQGTPKILFFCLGIKILTSLIHSKMSSKVNEYNWISQWMSSACQHSFPSRLITNTHATLTKFSQNRNCSVFLPRVPFRFPPSLRVYLLDCHDSAYFFPTQTTLLAPSIPVTPSQFPQIHSQCQYSGVFWSSSKT